MSADDKCLQSGTHTHSFERGLHSDEPVCRCGAKPAEAQAMKLHIDNDTLRRQILADPDTGCEGAGGEMSRFFMDHGMIHDRVTGQHVHTLQDIEPGGTERLFALLQELEAACVHQVVREDEELPLGYRVRQCLRSLGRYHPAQRVADEEVENSDVMTVCRFIEAELRTVAGTKS